MIRLPMGLKILPTLLGGGIKYLLRDDFSDTILAGSVNGTPATPGPGTRTVVDTNNKISIASGLLTFATGAAANDGMWLDLVNRMAGRVLLAKITPANTSGIPAFGWDANQSGAILDALLFNTTTGLQIVANGGTAFVVGSYTGATDYYIAAVMRSTGIYWFIKGGLFTYWTLLFSTNLGSANAYPAIQAQNAVSVFTADNSRVPMDLWLPLPLLYDTFTRGNGAIGDSETIGPDSQIVAAKAWAGATWTVASNRAVNTPATFGAEAVTDGDMEAVGVGDWADVATPTTKEKSAAQAHGGSQSLHIVGDAAGDGAGQTMTLINGVWYLASMWGYAVSNRITLGFDTRALGRDLKIVTGAAWAQGLGTGRGDGSARITPRSAVRDAGAGEFYLDDVSIVPLTLAELFASVNAANANIMQIVKVVALNSSGQASGMQAGGAIRLNSASTPTSGIIYYFDSGRVYCDEFTTATTWTNLITGTKAFTANDELIIWASGAAVRVYHRTAAGVVSLVGATASASVLTGDYAGLFSTHQSNTIEEVTVLPIGRSGEF